MSQEYAGTVKYAEEFPAKASEKKRIYSFLKRSGDVAVSLTGMIILSPVFLLLAVLVYMDDPGPILFAHQRVGKDGRKIRVWKFRSMRVNAEDIFEGFSKEQKEMFYRDFKLEEDPRITGIGNFLRKSSLDELPQLFNILKGDLSLVGPRPVVEEELEKYGMYKKKFLSVKPGLTGYWQANGRNLINYENGRKEMELYYIDHQSIGLDLKILAQTVFAVIKGRGAQ